MLFLQLLVQGGEVQIIPFKIIGSLGHDKAKPLADWLYRGMPAGTAAQYHDMVAGAGQ